MRFSTLLLTVVTLGLLSACTAAKTPVSEPVKNFDAGRYMGTWYEIARMPNRFQKDLQRVTAEYRLNEDGTFEVTNRGYNSEEGEWNSVIGKAEPIDDMPASFAVTFQWPFSGGYYIAELGDDYEYAVIVGDNTDYFWLLARQPHLPRWLIDQTLARAYEWGYDIEQIIETEH
ncbi:lipocalin family protein [Aliidiomarina soli]|uniref:Outer membrane lipoprotein Blc n=1 Tax=Aliidiomarina soli TaxID=1928574 RepID=A0A432WGN2_9GAMM|nr:lipocalin family protein [Aliidiomarina soli]RUO32938.1 hypothetical protein CWE14_06735 [Aliidiomarina soli]